MFLPTARENERISSTSSKASYTVTAAVDEPLSANKSPSSSTINLAPVFELALALTTNTFPSAVTSATPFASSCSAMSKVIKPTPLAVFVVSAVPPTHSTCQLLAVAASSAKMLNRVPPNVAEFLAITKKSSISTIPVTPVVKP